jgi:hypothetical protein
VSIRESLDSHEDELLEDLATFKDELIVEETKKIDESVVSLANDLISNIADQEFDADSDSDSDENTNDGSGSQATTSGGGTGSETSFTGSSSNIVAKNVSKTPISGEEMDEDLDFQLQLSEEDEEELGGLADSFFEAPLPAPDDVRLFYQIYSSN